MNLSFKSCTHKLHGEFLRFPHSHIPHLLQLVDASTLKKEVAEGVDLMVVRELTGG